jgi:uncharacterized protein YjbI with pentapeptide repeats
MDLSRAWDSIKKRLESDSLKEFGPPIVQIIGVFILAAYLLDLVWPWYKTNREAVVPLMTGIGGIIALAVAFGQFKTARLRHEEQTRSDLQRRITESFIKATEQLGSDKIEVRLGGIFTLERISKESPVDYWPVMETLSAFVRERPRTSDRRADEDSIFSDKPGMTRQCPTDLQSALTVIGRRHEKSREHERERGRHIDLSYANLQGAELMKAHLEYADLAGAHLEEANLFEVNLDGANLYGARLDRAQMAGAVLEEANLNYASLQGAMLLGAKLNLVMIFKSHFEGANLAHSHLQGVNFFETYLEGASFRGAHIERADFSLAHLGHGLKDFEFARGDASTVLPGGMQRPEGWPMAPTV